MDELERIRRCARPVIFETGIPEAPYSLAGTAFLVGFGNAIYILTARHVVRGYPAERLVIFTRDKPAFSAPLRIADYWNVRDMDDQESELSDLLIIKADSDGPSKRDRRKGQLLFLTPPRSTQWFDARFSALFFLCGYPDDLNSVDYEAFNMHTAQVMLTARYVGPSLRGCHLLQVKNPLGILSFNGMSGSPVFYHIEGNPLRPEVPSEVGFCGMVLRGSSDSNSIHFLSSEGIIEALKEAQRQRK